MPHRTESGRKRTAAGACRLVTLLAVQFCLVCYIGYRNTPSPVHTYGHAGPIAAFVAIAIMIVLVPMACVRAWNARVKQSGIGNEKDENATG